MVVDCWTLRIVSDRSDTGDDAWHAMRCDAML
jgi:hypothetical protein